MTKSRPGIAILLRILPNMCLWKTSLEQIFTEVAEVIAILVERR
jgi:hypothetical protein